MQFRFFSPRACFTTGLASGVTVATAALVITAVAWVTAAAAAAPAPAAAVSKSAAVAKELSLTLGAGKLDGMGAVDPSDPTVFVAAIYIPGTQLLVVSAKYAAPPLLLDKLRTRDYRSLYMDLHAAGVQGSRIFVEDQGADGLIWRAEANQAIDTWEENGKTMAFNGAWKKAKISEADYTKAFVAADERYTALLSLLLAQAKTIASD